MTDPSDETTGIIDVDELAPRLGELIEDAVHDAAELLPDISGQGGAC